MHKDLGGSQKANDEIISSRFPFKTERRSKLCSRRNGVLEEQYEISPPIKGNEISYSAFDFKKKQEIVTTQHDLMEGEKDLDPTP